MKKFTLSMLIPVLLLAYCTCAFAEETAVSKVPEFKVRMLNYFIMKNDRDFDRSRPIYSENGQTTGHFATVFEPSLRWRPIKPVTFVYALELGDNIWSRNDSDQQNPAAADQPVVKHKEFWSQVIFPGDNLGIRAGYQYIYDPTHLFIDRYMGSGNLFAQWEGNLLVLTVGQIPDGTYEGLDATNNNDRQQENNFENDDYLFAFHAEHTTGGYLFSPGLFFRWNKTEIDRPEGLLAPILHIKGKPCDRSNLEIDLVGMWGRHLRAGLDNRDVERLGGAIQIGYDYVAGPVLFDWNGLAFTSDDGDRYDQYDTGFAYSGWSKSRTLILSENWIRDQYDNLDERAADQKAGLILLDQDLRFHLAEDLGLHVIAGYARAFDNTHLSDDPSIGFEADLGLEWALYGRHVLFNIFGGAVFPGEGGAVLQNEIDMDAREPIYHVQGAMDLRF